ncbi:META domain-containing protein [Thiolapillus sp.]
MIFEPGLLRLLLAAFVVGSASAAFADAVDAATEKPAATEVTTGMTAMAPASAEPERHARGLIDGFELRGDLDEDGQEEIVLALWDDPGGSGTFVYLVVLDLVEGKVSSQSLFVGDRVQLLGGEILGNQISIDLVEHAATDPACCPSQKVTRTWAYDSNGGFREMPVKLTGKLSVEDIGGTEWVLVRLNNEPVSQELQISLIYEDGRIKGNAGCNNYFSDMKDREEEAGGWVKVGPVGSTRKVCPDEIMQVEGSYLKSIGNVTSFSFTGRQLVLSWNAADQSGALVFIPGKKLD